MRSNWFLARTEFGIVLENFRWDAIEFLAETKFGNVSEEFRWDAIENWLRQKLELSFKKSDEMQMNLGWDTVWKCLRRNKKIRWEAIEFWLRQILELA